MIKSSKSCFPSYMLVVFLCQVILETKYLESRSIAEYAKGFEHHCLEVTEKKLNNNENIQNLKKVPQLSACGVSVSSKA